jgi:hypothetical protein
VVRGANFALKRSEKYRRCPKVASRDTLGATFGLPWSRHTGRIHVLEAGPFVLPERAQNLPMLGLNQPSPTTIAELRKRGPTWPGQTSR